MTQDHFPNSSPDGSGDVDWDAVGRSLAGEEETEVASTGSDSDRRFIDALKRIPTAGSGGIDVEGALARVHERMDAADVVPLTHGRRPRGPLVRVLVGLAASAVLLVGGTLLWRAMGPGSRLVASTTIATATAERDSILLGDGTLVVLGPESELSIPPDYNATERTLTLRGEAFFDVKHDDSRPFTVRAGDALVRDIGTRFVVRSHRPDTVKVIVTQGAVSLKRASASADTGVLLHEGDVASLASGTAMPDVRRGGATDADVAWTRGALVFSDTPMTEVRDAVRRWYGIRLEIDPALADRHLTATFTTETPERVLDVIALSLGATIDRDSTVPVMRPEAAVRSR
jgi:transmembrane sensor